MDAFCRYGPSKGYFYAYGLQKGDQVQIWGRNTTGTWLWVHPLSIAYQCWVAASVLEITGNTSLLVVQPVRLPHSVLYGPPTGVAATRDGDQVTVTWERVVMTEDDDRGYMLDVNICQNGALVNYVVATNDPFYVFTDESTCSSSSGGKLYTVEKHGYTDPVDIPWP